MTRTLKFACITVVGLALAVTVGAQRRGGGSAMARSSVSMGARSIQSMGQGMRQPMRTMAIQPRTSFFSANAAAANRQVRVVYLSPSSRIFSAGSQSNGIHLTSGLGGNSISASFLHSGGNHSPRGTRNRFGMFIPILYGGYPYFDYADQYGDSPYSDAAYADGTDQQIQQSPQVVYAQEPGPAEQSPEPSPSDFRSDQTVPTTAAAAEPVPEAGEFILILRNGKALFASGYSVIGSDLRYITPEGNRRTLPLADLDFDSTRSMNDARGTTIQLQTNPSKN